MPPPPPPPPPTPAAPPPPPPTSKLGGSNGGGAGRGALLGAIEKGTKLKKVQTNDRSAPITGGNTNRGTGGSGPGPGGGSGGPVQSSAGGGLGGLFAGGVPRLPNRGNNSGPKRVPSNAPAFKPPGQRLPMSNGPSKISNGAPVNSGPPPPPPVGNKRLPIPPAFNKTTESSSNVNNSANGISPASPTVKLQPRNQPPPPPARPQSGTGTGSRPTSMVGRPLPPPPPPHQNQPPPPPSRNHVPPPPGRPTAPPPPARTTSNMGGGTLGRSSGPPAGRPPPPPTRTNIPPPPPPHAGPMGRGAPPPPMTQPPNLRRPNSTSSLNSGGDEFEKSFKFHSVDELPPPEPFSNSNKTYPSRNPKTGQASQRRAPPPPPPR